jgi:hypothetical protein
VSDDGLLAWATLWGKRLVALSLVAGLAAAAAGGGVLAVGALVDGGDSDTGLTGGGPGTETPVPPPPTATPTATATPTESPSTGAENESSDGVTRVVVGVEVADLQRPGRYRATVAEAVDYWRENADLAGYAVEPVVRPDAPDPDVTVRVQPNVTCAGDELAVGCAPQLRTAEDLGAPTVVRVEPRPNDRLTRQIVTHELGHVFGVGHCGQPRRFMYTDCPPENRTGDRPDADEGDSPWSGDTVRVYVDTEGTTPGPPAVLRVQVQKALEYYEGSFADGDTAVPPVELELVEDPYRADVYVHFVERTRTCSLPTVCSDRFGVSTDADDALEHYSYARIELALTDPQVVGWQVGYQLGFILGADGIDDLPPAFREDGTDTDGDWWTGD